MKQSRKFKWNYCSPGEEPKIKSHSLLQLTSSCYKEVVGEQVNPAAMVSVMEKSSKRNEDIADIIITLVLECGFQ